MIFIEEDSKLAKKDEVDEEMDPVDISNDIVCADQAYDQNAVNAVRGVSLKNWEVHISCSMELSTKYGN